MGFSQNLIKIRARECNRIPPRPLQNPEFGLRIFRSDWEENEAKKNNSESIEEKHTENISIYAATVISVFLLAFARAVFWFQILTSASRHLHDKMFKTILRARIYFFDTNPVGKC